MFVNSIWSIRPKCSEQLRQLLYSLLIVGVATLNPTTIWGQDPDSSPAIIAETDPAPKKLPPLALGVSVADSPGTGVLVKGVAWGSPANRAGINSGDFLMAIANRPIEKPQDLREHLSELASEKKLNVTLWRDGVTLTKPVKFDPKFSDSTREKAWLGLMLQMSRGGDVLIADVMPASPAEEIGIQVGDTVLRLNAENIDSVAELTSLMKKIRSGDNVEVTVLRNGEERTFTVRVGSAVQRTMRWFEERIPSERDPFDRLERWRERVPEIEVDRYMDSFESMIDRLREEMDNLRDEVERLRDQQNPSAAEAETEPDSRPGPEDTSSNNRTVSTIDTILPVALANEGDQTRTRSYADYRGGRSQVRYRYPRGYYARNYRTYRPRVYYYPPAYRYPAYVYPRTPSMMYYGPSVRVTYGPWVYAY